VQIPAVPARIDGPLPDGGSVLPHGTSVYPAPADTQRFGTADRSAVARADSTTPVLRHQVTQQEGRETAQATAADRIPALETLRNTPHRYQRAANRRASFAAPDPAAETDVEPTDEGRVRVP